MSCRIERSRADVGPLPPRPPLRANLRRSWRAVTMTKCASASSDNAATSSFNSVRDKRAASTSMLSLKGAGLLSNSGERHLMS